MPEWEMKCMIEGIVGRHEVPGRNEVANDYWRCVQSRR